MNAVQWLSRLISFNTVSTNSNLQLIQDIDSWFKNHHIESTIIPAPTADKVNLLATIPARDGATSGGLLLSGHTDVVPVTGQAWDSDPFTAIERDGLIYGRGACDMKGFIAVVLSLVPDFQKLNLLKPIHFSFTCDEEIGCLGVDYLVEYLQKTKIYPEGCIVGEPSNMRPIIGEKGRRLYHCQIHGKAVHSSLASQGCNAIEYASRLISYVNDLARYVEENGPFDEYYDIPFTTISTNVMSGGIATNIVPGTCEFILEFRYTEHFPFQNFCSQIENYINDNLLPDMRKNYTEAAIYFDQTSDSEGFNASEDALITRLIRTITGVTQRQKVSYGTESGIFQHAHIPTVICGPGDIQQAHRPNEFVSIEQLNLCDKVLRNLVHFFCVDLEK